MFLRFENLLQITITTAMQYICILKSHYYEL